MTSKSRLEQIIGGTSGLPPRKVDAYKQLPNFPSSEQHGYHPVAIARVKVSGVETAHRIEICESNRCGFYSEGQCTHGSCGTCLKTVEKKALWADQTCPLGMWEERIKEPDGSDMNSKVTACITHFKRPEQLARLIESIKQFYPGLRILVEDTGGNLSAARNRLAAKCPTPYMLLLEEDFVFTKETNVDALLQIMEENPQLGGASGRTYEPKARGSDGRGYDVWWDRDFVRIRDKIYLAPARRAKRSTGGVEWQPCDLVLNFGVFRAESFREVPWDENLPVQEHTDGFYRFHLDGRWHFAHAHSVSIDHTRDRPSTEYNRNRNRDFTDYLRKKHNATFIKDSVPPTLNVPNVVVLGVGRCNSTIITKQAAHAFHLNLGDVDLQFYEHREIRRVNEEFMQTGQFDKLAARRALRAIPQPWIIKDPRFRRTFHLWEGLLKEFDPLVVQLKKNEATVKASYEKQNWGYDPQDHERVQKFYNGWVGKKLSINAEDIGIACSFFDFKRLKLVGSA